MIREENKLPKLIIEIYCTQQFRRESHPFSILSLTMFILLRSKPTEQCNL